MGSTCGIHIDGVLPQCCSGTGLLTPTHPRSHERYCENSQHRAFSYELNTMKRSSFYSISRRMPFCRCSSGYYKTDWPMWKCKAACISHLGPCTAEWPLKKKPGGANILGTLSYFMSCFWHSIVTGVIGPSIPWPDCPPKCYNIGHNAHIINIYGCLVVLWRIYMQGHACISGESRDVYIWTNMR